MRSTRRLGTWFGSPLALLFVLALVLPARPALADLENLKAATNGLLQFPADPIMGVIEPPADFEYLPGAVVTSRVLGLPAGILMGTYRAAMGLTDIVFAPFWVLPVMSPEARWEFPISGIEYE